MIDFISFWKKQVERWNEANYCNQCWTFGFPQSNDKMNQQQVTDEEKCCIQVMVTDLGWSDTPRFNFQTGLRLSTNQITKMTVHFLKPGEMGRDFYNETLGHPIEESKWEQIIKPLAECINESEALEWCTILGHKTELVSWDKKIRTNWLDQNYDGLTIQMSFRSTIY